MEALQQIVRNKLLNIRKYSQQPQIQGFQELTVQELLKEKKKQASGSMIQSRLLQTLLGKRIQNTQAGKFYDDSLEIMRIYHPYFQPEKSEDDIYASIVGLYAQFFTEQGCIQRADEIIHIYKKKVCDQQVLVPNIFSWFVQWTKKQYHKFLRQKLQEKDSKPKIKETSPRHRNFSRVDFVQEKAFDQQFQNSKSLSKNIKQTKPFQSMTQPVSAERNFIKQIIQTKQTKDEKIILNRQIIYGVFYDELTFYYQNYASSIADLDIGILRTVKKNDSKKDTLKKRLDQVSKVLVRSHQSNVKKAVDQYSKKYNQKFHQINNIQQKNSCQSVQKQVKNLKGIQNKVSLIRVLRNSSFLLRQKRQAVCLPDILQQRRSKKSEQKQHKLSQSKRLNLQLPQISQYERQKQTKNLVYRSGRYFKEKSLSNNKKGKMQYCSAQDISVDLNNQIKQINQILRVNKADDYLCSFKRKASVLALKKSQRTSPFRIQSTHQANNSILSNLNLDRRMLHKQKFHLQRSHKNSQALSISMHNHHFDIFSELKEKEKQLTPGVFDIQFRF